MSLDTGLPEQSSQTEETVVQKSGERHYLIGVDIRYGLNHIKKGVIGLLHRKKRIVHDDLGTPQATNEAPPRYLEFRTPKSTSS